MKSHSSAAGAANHRSANYRTAMRIAVVMLAAFCLASPASASHGPNHPPVASFKIGFTTPEPLVGERITFTSDSSDFEDEIDSHAWDLDEETTFDDGNGSSARETFDTPGEKEVRLRVRDDDNATSISVQRFTVQPFSMSATEVNAGTTVNFIGSDLGEEDVDTYEWDFDGNGTTDASGRSVSRTFANSGTFNVTLTVSDSEEEDARSESASRLLKVNSPPAPPPGDPGTGTPPPGGSGTGTPPPGGSSTEGFFGAPTGTAPTTPAPRATVLIAPRLLAPFPSVRVRGVATMTGVRVDLLSVRTPGGTRILVLCKGRDCPWKRKLLNARFSARKVGLVRIPGFKRRKLRAGSVVEVFVTRRGMIGKYTRFKFRKLKGPQRVDRCTAVGTARAQRCPAR